MDYVRTFESYGVAFTGQTGPEHYGICCFCGSPKFYLNETSGQWSCKAGGCNRVGNLYTFLSQIWEEAYGSTMETQYRRLSKDRGINVPTLKHFGLAYNGTHWLLPIRSPEGKIIQLRRCKLGKPLLNTSGIKSALFHAECLNRKAQTVWICEGEWDAMRFWQVLRKADLKDLVIAAPGANVWKDEWTALLLRKQVNLVYDADPAGAAGMDRVAGELVSLGVSVQRVEWPEEVTKGFDIRDFFNGGGRYADLHEYMVNASYAQPAEAKSIDADGNVVSKRRARIGRDLKFVQVVDEFRKWLHMTDETVDALRLLMAVALSNRIEGDPLWMFLVAPPGGCKTELLMSLSGTPEAVVKSTLTPHSLVSGFRMPGGLDPSLIPQLHGRVFVLKDFTEVLQMPRVERDEVYSILRGAYDGVVEKTFGNGVTRKYSCHFSMIAGVTYHIQADRTAALGERFLMYKMRGSSDTATILKAMKNSGHEDSMRSELKAVAARFLAQDFDAEKLPEVNDSMLEKFVVLAQLVSVLRGEVVKDFREEKILYRPAPEVGTRLAKQLKKLSQCLQLLDGGRSVTPTTYDLVERIALDTCKGFELEVFKEVGASGKDGVATTPLTEKLDLPRGTLRDVLEDLTTLGLLDRVRSHPGGRRGASEYRYTLSSMGQKYWQFIYQKR